MASSNNETEDTRSKSVNLRPRPHPAPKRHITTHNSSGGAIIHSSDPFPWTAFDGGEMSFSVLYTTSSMPADLNDNKDLTVHTELMDKTQGKLGLVNRSGTVIRCVDFAPGYTCAMHRTQSLDYGIVLIGEIEMILDGGEKERVVMRPGDMAVQRATQHQWRNCSETEWARMMFVLQDIKPLEVGGVRMKEDLGTEGDLPASGNDD